jgi:hypothetical protein
MKRKWQVRRLVVERSDGQRRWDIAYQLLLHWAMEPTGDPLPGGTPSQENEHEDRPVYQSIDALSNAKSNH